MKLIGTAHDHLATVGGHDGQWSSEVLLDALSYDLVWRFLQQTRQFGASPSCGSSMPPTRRGSLPMLGGGHVVSVTQAAESPATRPERQPC